jgi:Zn-dependent peptidase ImmA (M78 family)
MWVTVNGTNSSEIDDDVVRRVLGIYPEEALVKRPVFEAAISNGRIEYSDLQDESEKILIPWQMFFLTSANLDTQIAHIESERQHKVSSKLMAKRRGVGNVTSKRIIDRLIRQQNFLTSTAAFSNNSFCGSLKGVRTQQAAEQILANFGIKRETLWSYRTKGAALEHVIKKFEGKNVNVSRGVLSNKLLPMWNVVPSDVYRNTSGFAIKDERVPFIFLPSELNPDEIESRQIYTLMYLVSVIGLDQYDYVLDKNFRAKMQKAQGVEARIHAITTEILMPAAELDKLRGESVTFDLRDELSKKFKVSPLALVVTLRMRGIITKKEYDALKPPPYVPQKTSDTEIRAPRVSTSVRKFCGLMSFRAINDSLRSGTLQRVQAQHLIFGGANKKGFKRYCSELNL